jgi:hypothetical protein
MGTSPQIARSNSIVLTDGSRAYGYAYVSSAWRFS